MNPVAGVSVGYSPLSGIAARSKPEC